MQGLNRVLETGIYGRIMNSRFGLVGFLLVIFFLLMTPHSVSAHFLKTDGSIGAVLHVDPDDDPIVGQPTGFFFEFKDKEGKFKPENCDCVFSVEEAGKQIYSQPLFQNNTSPSLSNSSVFFTFPGEAVYQVIVTGRPNSANAFQTFKLSYDLRVDREAQNSQINTPPASSGGLADWIKTHVIHLIGGLLVVIFLIFAFVKQGQSKNP